jgi:hypothetical protein
MTSRETHTPVFELEVYPESCIQWQREGRRIVSRDWVVISAREEE